MSVTRPPNAFSEQPPAISSYQYPSEGNMRLPPMSSLLRPEEQVEQKPGQYPSQPPQSQPYSQIHPLQFSEINPNAPIHHIYHPSHPSGAPRYHPEPVMVPVQPQRTIEPIQYEGPSAQRRQSKKISQRRADLPKDHVQVNRSSVPLEGRYAEPANSIRSPNQESTSFAIQRKYSEPSPTEPQKRSVPISNMLSETNEPKRPAPIYTLTIRQQPQSARACGYGERDRRVVDPPPILVLDIENPTGRPETYVVICILWNADSNTDASSMPESNERRQQRRLMGTNVSSPFPGKDEYNIPRTFFTFPDISVRTPGTYRLKFNLCVMDLMTQGPGSKNPVATHVMSDPFQVFNAKDFGGMQASSALTRSLKAQGCLIPVKKGNSKTNASHSRDGGDDDDDVDDDMDDAEDDMTKPPRPEKRIKR